MYVSCGLSLHHPHTVQLFEPLDRLLGAEGVTLVPLGRKPSSNILLLVSLFPDPVQPPGDGGDDLILSSPRIRGLLPNPGSAIVMEAPCGWPAPPSILAPEA